jgi:hypothetical protein
LGRVAIIGLVISESAACARAQIEIRHKLLRLHEIVFLKLNQNLHKPRPNHTYTYSGAHHESRGAAQIRERIMSKHKRITAIRFALEPCVTRARSALSSRARSDPSSSATCSARATHSPGFAGMGYTERYVSALDERSRQHRSIIHEYTPSYTKPSSRWSASTGYRNEAKAWFDRDEHRDEGPSMCTYRTKQIVRLREMSTPTNA